MSPVAYILREFTARIIHWKKVCRDYRMRIVKNTKQMQFRNDPDFPISPKISPENVIQIHLQLFELCCYLTDRQTNEPWQKYDLLGGVKKKRWNIGGETNNFPIRKVNVKFIAWPGIDHYFELMGWIQWWGEICFADIVCCSHKENWDICFTLLLSYFFCKFGVIKI